MKKYNYKFFAAKTGCSIATVSRFFQGQKINPTFAAKIQATLDEFKLNEKLITQKHSKKATIFLLTAHLENAVNYRVINYLKNNLSNNYLLFIKTISQKEDYKSLLQVIKSFKPYCLILFYNHWFDHPNFWKELEKLNIKILIYGKKILNWSSFYVAETTGIIKALDYIKTKTNFKKIGYIGCDPQQNLDDQNLYQARYEAAAMWQTQHQNDYELKIKLISNNNVELAIKAMHDIVVWKPDIIISGSHTIFRASDSFVNYDNFKFTDIGFFSLKDHLKKYFLKIFINYDLIGKLLLDAIDNQETLMLDYVVEPIVLVAEKD